MRHTLRSRQAIAVGVAFAAVTGGVVGTTSGAVGTADWECANAEATVVGTDASEVLHGDPNGPDVIAGLGGDDVILTGDGRDIACGNSGDDTIRASGTSKGPVRFDGGSGADTIRALGTGNNTVWGHDGDDYVVSGSGADGLELGAGDDEALSGAGNDNVIGKTGDDFVNCGTGSSDHFVGGSDTDWQRACEMHYGVP